MKSLLLFTLLSLTLLFNACQNEQTTTESTITQNEEEDLSDFNTFYDRFHSDSVFQKEHILFPLQGLPSDADSLTLANKNFKWTEDTWTIQHEIDPQSGFSTVIFPVDSALVIEQIMHKTGQYAMERRFAKMNDEWMLIYYAGLNRVKN